MQRVILGVTGSVAATLTKRLYTELSKNNEVKTITTKSADMFIDCRTGYGNANTDEEYWYKQTKEVAHIELRKWADMLVIAPLSANTLGKIANGLCDNLLTNIARAWDFRKPFIVCPAMNTMMWEHPVTCPQLQTLHDWGVTILRPQVKLLACGDHGVGAMCNIEDIVTEVNLSLLTKESQDLGMYE